MSRKGGNFFEEHIEKIILAVVGVVCIWLLVSRVFVSTNMVEYRGERLSPGEIDKRIRQQAESWEHELSRNPEPKQPYEKMFDGFAVLVDGSVPDGNRLYGDLYPIIAKSYPQCAQYAMGNIDIGVDFDLPPYASEIVEDREYRLPVIGNVEEVSVEAFRAMAYLPTVLVDDRNAYDQSRSEPNDIDFVTVAAKFDVAKLYESFHECFMGEDVPEDWRDPCLVKPVFAAVQLERQQLLDEGSWSGWQDVPRARIDPRREMFTLEDVEKLPTGGIDVQLFRFDRSEVIRELFQPEPYVIASADEEWFPPELHEKYLDIQKKIEAQEKREAKKEEKRDEERKRRDALMGPGRGSSYTEREWDTYGQRRRSPYVERRRDPYFRGDRGRGGLIGRSERGRSDPRLLGGRDSSKTTLEDAIDDLYRELDKILITNKTDMSEMSESLVFWAHDDTVEPGRSYRYRIRLGVFNPVVEMNQVEGRDESENNVVIWSRFSEVTETVAVPERLYFFPVNVAEAAKVVTVRISRYVLGYWYSRNFVVQQGEVIGKVVENKEVEDEAEGAKTGHIVPETVDYSTGAVLVDVTTVNGWAGGGGKNLRARPFSDMLYSFDGTTVEHMPIKYGFWPRNLQAKYGEINKLEDKLRKPPRPWRSRLASTKRPTRRRTEEGSEEYSREDDDRAEAEAWRALHGKR